MPEGWEYKALEDVCDKASSNISQNQLENEKGEYPIFGASGLIKKISFYHREKPYLSIIKDGAGVGRIMLLDGKSSIIGTLQYLLPRENINIKFLHFLLSGIDFKKYISGSTIPHIYFKDYKNLPIPLPPLAEQQKIVQVLDTALGKIDKAIAFLKENVERVEQLNLAILDVTFKKVGKDFEYKKLNDIATVQRGKSKHRPRNEKKLFGGKYPFIQTGDIRNADKYITTFSQTYSDFGLAQSRLWKKGTICLTIAANIGDVAILGIDACFPDSVVGLYSEKLNNEFLYYFLKTKQLEFNHLASAAAQKNLSVGKFEETLIPFPPLKTQHRIVSYLSETIEQNKILVKAYQTKIENLQKLKSSLLEAAFTGALAKQNVFAIQQPMLSVAAGPTINYNKVAANGLQEDEWLQLYFMLYNIGLHNDKPQQAFLAEVKMEKSCHIGEYKIPALKFNRNPKKEMNGPADFERLFKLHNFAAANDIFYYDKKASYKKYTEGKNFYTYFGKATTTLKPFLKEVKKLLNILLPVKTDPIDIYATTFAAWNNLLILKKPITLKALATEARWHEKKNRFTDNDFEEAIKFLKDNNLEPNGQGKLVKGK